jgi:hypothetical protein
MSNATLILHQLLPSDAVKIGRLVLNVQHPEHDFYEPEISYRSSNDIITQNLEKFSLTLERTKASRAHGILTSFSSAAFGSRGNSTVSVSSAHCITRSLKNSGDYFNRIGQSESLQDWFERAIRRRRNVFLVVGIKSLVDSDIIQGQARSIEVEGSIQIPVALAAAAAGVVLPVGNALNVSAGASELRQSDERMTFTAPGEQILAVQYRKIVFSVFSARDITKARPEAGCRWERFLGARGEEEDIEETIEAELRDYRGTDDLDGLRPESFSFENEELLYLS